MLFEKHKKLKRKKKKRNKQKITTTTTKTLKANCFFTPPSLTKLLPDEGEILSPVWSKPTPVGFLPNMLQVLKWLFMLNMRAHLTWKGVLTFFS